MKKYLTPIVFVLLLIALSYFGYQLATRSNLINQGDVSAAAGSNIFSATSFLNTPIPATARYEPETRIGTFRPNEEVWSMPIYRVPSTENPPLVAVTNRYSGRVENWPIPTYAVPTAESDARFAVVFKDRNIIYEFWDAKWVGTTKIDAGGMKDFPYNGSAISDPIHRRVTASGFAGMAGMITKENFTRADGVFDKTLHLNHALTMSLPSAHALSTGFVAPAVGGEETGRLTNGIPMGARFAFPKSLNVDALNVHPLTKEIARAARDYGIFINDGNGAPLYNNKWAGAMKYEPGLAELMYNSNTDAVRAIVESETAALINTYGFYRVYTDGSAATSSSSAVSTTASSSRASSTVVSTATSVASSSRASTLSATSTSRVSSVASSSRLSSVSSSRLSSAASSAKVLPLGCKADYGRDGTVGTDDYVTFAGLYKKTLSNCALDIVGNDCRYTIVDFTAFAEVYKKVGACLP